MWSFQWIKTALFVEQSQWQLCCAVMSDGVGCRFLATSANYSLLVISRTREPTSVWIRSGTNSRDRVTEFTVATDRYTLHSVCRCYIIKGAVSMGCNQDVYPRVAITTWYRTELYSCTCINLLHQEMCLNVYSQVSCQSVHSQVCIITVQYLRWMDCVWTIVISLSLCEGSQFFWCFGWQHVYFLRASLGISTVRNRIFDPKPTLTHLYATPNGQRPYLDPSLWLWLVESLLVNK